MILRTIARHVREQNWTAIAIDFVIVVMGVFLGIQLGNWNDARADDRLGDAYSERLLVDLQKERATRQRLADYYGAVTTSAERTAALLEEPLADPLALVMNAYRATEYSYSPQTRATWDEIVSSGHVGLIDRDVGEGASEYYAYDVAAEALRLMQNSGYRHRVRSLIPHRIQQAIRERCGDVREETGEIVGFRNDCNLEVDSAEVRQVAALLRSDPLVLEGLRYQFSDLTTARANISGVIVYLDQAIGALGGEIPAPTSSASQ